MNAIAGVIGGRSAIALSYSRIWQSLAIAVASMGDRFLRHAIDMHQESAATRPNHPVVRSPKGPHPGILVGGGKEI